MVKSGIRRCRAISRRWRGSTGARGARRCARAARAAPRRRGLRSTGKQAVDWWGAARAGRPQRRPTTRSSASTSRPASGSGRCSRSPRSSPARTRSASGHRRGLEARDGRRRRGNPFTDLFTAMRGPGRAGLRTVAGAGQALPRRPAQREPALAATAGLRPRAASTRSAGRSWRWRSRTTSSAREAYNALMLQVRAATRSRCSRTSWPSARNRAGRSQSARALVRPVDRCRRGGLRRHRACRRNSARSTARWSMRRCACAAACSGSGAG